MYRNPEEILINAEARTCKGCTFKVMLWGIGCCAMDQSKSGKKMRRCKNYKEGRLDGGQSSKD